MPLIGSGLLSAGGAPAFVGAYDGISNLAAVYSVRRVLTSYTGPLLRLRRDSDNAESDFGYVAATGDLDTAAIATWLGGATGYVTTWYDQSGNVKHISQAEATRQPSLVLSSAPGGNRPCIYYDGVNDRGTSATAINAPQFCLFVSFTTRLKAYQYANNSSGRLALGKRVDSSRAWQYAASSSDFGYADGSVRVDGVETANFGDTYANISSWTRGSAVDTFGGDNWSWFGSQASATFEERHWLGPVYEFIAMTSIPSTADHNAIGASAASYYGLTWNTIA